MWRRKKWSAITRVDAAGEMNASSTHFHSSSLSFVSIRPAVCSGTPCQSDGMKGGREESDAAAASDTRVTGRNVHPVSDMSTQLVFSVRSHFVFGDTWPQATHVDSNRKDSQKCQTVRQTFTCLSFDEEGKRMQEELPVVHEITGGVRGTSRSHRQSLDICIRNHAAVIIRLIKYLLHKSQFRNG